MALFSFIPARTMSTFMQKTLFLGFLTFIFALRSFKSFSGLDDVISALKAGNAQELAKYIDDNIIISLPDKTDSYSKAQSIVVLQDFFANNGVKGFELQFKGENGGSQFCVGKLITKSGSYRTTVFMKTKNGRQLVKEIRFRDE